MMKAYDPRNGNGQIPTDTAPAAGPSLDDAAVGAAPATELPPEKKAAGPMTTEQVVGVLAMLTSFGLPPERAEYYRKELEADSNLAFSLEVIEFADALAEYGISNAGKMPAWVRLILGAGIVGFAVMAARGKHAKNSDDHGGAGDGHAGQRADAAGGLGPAIPGAAS